MALIFCSECGKQISDQAKTCTHCGCPIISKDGMVAIKTPALIAPFLSHNLKILNNENGEVLWSGRQGEVARFKISEPTEILIQFSKNAMFSGIKNVKATIQANKKYTCTQDLGVHLFAKFHLTEVDIIDC